ncbi:MAG: cell division ATP-binding protein FtsE [Saprospiraceae bacterium]
MESPIVTFNNAAVFQSNQQCVLHEVNLDIRSGTFNYLIGRTGSGKSSLLKTIYAALPLLKGEGKVAGFDLTTLNRKSIPLLRRKLGIVFQELNLLSDRNAEANLKFVLRATGWMSKKKMKARIEEVLESVQLKGYLNKMPHELSGGERQRLAIARAILNKPQLLIADEPTGNLDPDTADLIVELIKELSEANNTAVLFATHDYRLMERFPARIIRCSRGRVLDEENFVV